MIDKNKAYRFRGDSERVQWNDDIRALAVGTAGWIGESAAEHLHQKGILLEYPELPGEDWEFCERDDQERTWCDDGGNWVITISPCELCRPIYCRKKKPVYRSGKVEPGEDLTITSDVGTIYWTTDPEKGKELLS